MNLADSRSTSEAKEQFRSTGGSFFAKATGRNTKPNWSYRIQKDFNDLEYNVMTDRFANPNAFKNTEAIRKQKVKADLNKRRKSKKKVGREDSLAEDQKVEKATARKIKGMSRSVVVSNPQRIYLDSMESSDSKFYGLSPFEYQNTIQGKIQKKPSLHLSFQKSKVYRKSNEYAIYYNRHEDIDFSFSNLMNERKKMKKYHHFGSYLERKGFQTRDELDKIFDEDHSRRLSSPKRIKETVLSFEKVTGRKDPKYSESVSLTFQTAPCLEKIARRAESYSIPMTERKTSFTRQIIDDKRGCYR